ncbi:hypothetical protein [Glutamicibacter sp.]|jgi:hypothetical protein|uniref:hypothetical protein n=1 Tax=Glutamicibacter sp. TaxID=1931995 RepID=UPI002FDA8038
MTLIETKIELQKKLIDWWHAHLSKAVEEKDLELARHCLSEIGSCERAIEWAKKAIAEGKTE